MEKPNRSQCQARSAAFGVTKMFSPSIATTYAYWIAWVGKKNVLKTPEAQYCQVSIHCHWIVKSVSAKHLQWKPCDWAGRWSSTARWTWNHLAWRSRCQIKVAGNMENTPYHGSLPGFPSNRIVSKWSSRRSLRQKKTIVLILHWNMRGLGLNAGRLPDIKAGNVWSCETAVKKGGGQPRQTSCERRCWRDSVSKPSCLWKVWGRRLGLDGLV